MAVDIKKNYGMKSLLEKKRKKIVINAIRLFIQKSNVDFVARK